MRFIFLTITLFSTTLFSQGNGIGGNRTTKGPSDPETISMCKGIQAKIWTAQNDIREDFEKLAGYKAPKTIDDTLEELALIVPTFVLESKTIEPEQGDQCDKKILITKDKKKLISHIRSSLYQNTIYLESAKRMCTKVIPVETFGSYELSKELLDIFTKYEKTLP